MKKDIQDYLDELEDLAWNREASYKITSVRNKIDECIATQKPQWNKLTFRPLDIEEKEFHPEWTEWVEGLPEFDKNVLVTDGNNIWIDSFDIDGYIYLSGTDSDLDEVKAWMELPGPYKEG